MNKLIFTILLISIFAVGIVSGAVATSLANIKVSDKTLNNYPTLNREIERVGDDYESLRGRDYAVVIMEDINIYDIEGKHIIGIIPKGTVIPTKQLES